MPKIHLNISHSWLDQARNFISVSPFVKNAVHCIGRALPLCCIYATAGFTLALQGKQEFQREVDRPFGRHLVVRKVVFIRS